MKKGRNLSLLLVALVALIFSCQSEGVDPNKKGNPSDLQGSLTDNHEMLETVCGDARVYALVSTDGSQFVNRCWGPVSQGHPVINCPAVMPKWGTVTIQNGPEHFNASFLLAPGWYVQSETYCAANFANYTYDPNGVPLTTGNNWVTKAIDPVMNEWSIQGSMNGLGNKFGVAAKITVIKLNLLGNMVPGSATTLWLKDLGQVEAGQSPYTISWLRNWCPEQWPAPVARCEVVNMGVPALTGCRTLEPTLDNPVGTVNYSWSTGETTPTINVCPTVTTTYTVRISDASGPRSQIAYTVNVRNVFCTQGNNNNVHKVNVCHIPPGNPNNPQEICIDWSGVAAHVASFRPAGSTQGHDSGCEIGKCGSNPCAQ